MKMRFFVSLYEEMLKNASFAILSSLISIDFVIHHIKVHQVSIKSSMDAKIKAEIRHEFISGIIKWLFFTILSPLYSI